MKKIIYSTLTIIGALVFNNIDAQYCGNSGSSVCVPSSTLTTPGFENPDSIPCPIQGEAYNQSIQFQMFDVFNYLGSQMVDSIEFNPTQSSPGIGNLPCNLCWATNNVNNRFTKGDYGCINITGTTSDSAGQYELAINLLAWINHSTTGPISVPAPLVQQAGVRLWLRVQSPSGSCLPVDTASSFTGLTASSGCVTGITPINDNLLSLSIIPNPVKANSVVKFVSFQHATYMLRITDMMGKVISGKEIEAKPGENTSAIESGNLPAGTYFLSISNGSLAVTKRFAVIN